MNARGIWLASLAYALLYCAFGAQRYATYTSGSDLGLFAQSVATVFHGFANTTEGGSHFTFHFSPILYALAPALWLSHSALALTFSGAFACALAAPPLFFIARKRMPERTAFLVATVALVYAPLAGVAFADFHENVFAPAATLWLLWAVDARRWSAATAFLALALCIKEDQAALLAGVGACGLAFYGTRRDRDGAIFCACGALASLATLVLFFEVVRPAAGATAPWGPTHFYAWSQQKGPAPAWYGRPAYFLEALAPLAFACVASPAFVLALPGFAEVLGSHEPITYTMGEHYAAVWIGYVLFAFASGIATIRNRNPVVADRFIAAALALCLINLVFASPTHWGHYLRLRNAHDAAIDRSLARLAPEQNVGTFDALYSHLGFDPHAELGLVHGPRYALVDEKATNIALDVACLKIVHAGVAKGAYRMLWNDDGVELYESAGARR